ncbi:hypothetical protein DVR12_24220 [Chitinophaga silvatica]|uniref:Uncharacterized protein n=1 Tax=Chitinophaga silvatica TaxID=2282649 RepID=A0A3E1Y3T9_9BACT|nr:hypothetical protein [Chitinophaga silvatica]RFS19339.1 hypothetical protein DVR12_24220 [Chitinophaga silvatica]
MKSILTLFILLLFAAAGNSQTNFVKDTGYVGIGTISPGSRLHIVDNTRSYYVNRGIPGYTRDGDGLDYILLHEIYDGINLTTEHFVMGLITGIRGGAGAYNRKLTLQVNTASAYNSTSGSLLTYNEISRLVTLVYNSKKYLAVQISRQATLFYFSFTGYATNAALQLVRDNTVTDVVEFKPTDPIGIMGDLSLGTYSRNLAKLEIGNGPVWTTNNWNKAIRLSYDGAIEFPGTTKTFGMGTKESSFYFFSGNTDGTGAADYYMVADGTSGNVAIGGRPVSNYKLVVDGSLGARKVKIQQGTWSDYVFHENYKLLSLPETEEFIKSNKHLPDVPSEAEVKREGVDVGEMNKILLQKIEELTLHIIKLNKDLSILNVKVATLQEQLEKK